ncbi:MAG TPA: hypothetical protein ENO23_05785 [Alphaproteobacteria bacterium]|nr:hypothetical protein [Alphaproteobacteria bacterium]
MNWFRFTALVASVGSTASQGAREGGLTLGELLADIPHDAAAFVVYAMVLGSALFVWRAGRAKPPGTPNG